MSNIFHNIEVINIDDGARPIRTVRSSVVGLVGTAPDADTNAFPLNTPVLIPGSRIQAAGLDTVGNQAGTLPKAIDDIFDQAGAMIVVIRVEEGADFNATKANVIGGVQPDGSRTGLQALLDAKSIVKVTPKIIVAPGFTHDLAVATEMPAILERLGAIAFIDGPNTTDADAITYRENFGTKRFYHLDPWVKVFDTVTAGEIIRPASARAAGIMVKSDDERGFWHSPSNREMFGILGTARPIDFELGDGNSTAEYLNENEVGTIIQEDGYRLWGNRTGSDDPKWAFLSVVRIADMINRSILVSHRWALDRNITKTYIDDVTEGVNNYLNNLKARGAILGGECWADPALNTADQICQGDVTFDFDFTPPFPAERIHFRSHLVKDYIEEIFV